MLESHICGTQPILRPERSPARRVLPHQQAPALDILVPEAPPNARDCGLHRDDCIRHVRFHIIVGTIDSGC